MHDWRAASEKEVTVDGRIAVGVLASFVEGLSTTASLAEAGEFHTMCLLIRAMLATMRAQFQYSAVLCLFLIMCANDRVRGRRGPRTVPAAASLAISRGRAHSFKLLGIDQKY